MFKNYIHLSQKYNINKMKKNKYKDISSIINFEENEEGEIKSNEFEDKTERITNFSSSYIFDYNEHLKQKELLISSELKGNNFIINSTESKMIHNKKEEREKKDVKYLNRKMKKLKIKNFKGIGKKTQRK
jgi:hypothetical protein